jgi:hypothetical protein
MSEKPEALRLAENLENPWHGLMVSSRLLPGVDPLIVGGLRADAAAELRRQHAEIERLREALEKVLAADDDPNDKLTYIRSRTRVIIRDALRREPGDG